MAVEVTPPAPAEPAPLPEAMMSNEMGPEMASVQPPPRPQPMRPPAPMRRPPPPPPPPVNVGTLIGSDFTAVLRVLRSPDTVQTSNLSVVWIYSPPGCTLQLFFYPDIATTTFHLLKFDLRSTAGAALMTTDPCLQRIGTTGNAGAAPH